MRETLKMIFIVLSIIYLSFCLAYSMDNVKIHELFGCEYRTNSYVSPWWRCSMLHIISQVYVGFIIAVIIGYFVCVLYEKYNHKKY